MHVNQRLCLSVALALGLSMLAACEGQQATQSALGVVPSAQGASKIDPDGADHYCKDKHVSLSPCYIYPGLGPSEGMTVTISGSAVVSSSFDNTSKYCYDHGNMRKCLVAMQVAPTQWLVYYRNCNGPGHVAASAYISGINAHGRIVGTAYLRVHGLRHTYCEKARGHD